MQLSWTGLKISIAGAKLSHLAHRDRIWDHGTMVEQVRIIFQQLQKAIRKGDPGLVKKYLTPAAFLKTVEQIAQHRNRTDQDIYELDEVDIIGITQGKNSKPDCFKTLLKGKKRSSPITDAEAIEVGFKEEWMFIRQGDWWVLNKLK